MLMYSKGNGSMDVLLKPTNTQLYHENGNEPQYVTGKQPQNGWIYLDSKNSTSPDKTNAMIHPANPLAINCNRIRVAGVGARFFIPNVNPRNNNLQFWSSVTNSVWDVTLNVRYYDKDIPADVAQLVADIVTALNSVASGLTFSSAPIAGFPRTYEILAVGGTFYWIPTCSCVAKGNQMYGFERITTQSIRQRLGTMGMIYTNYVDIKSTELTKWQKMRSLTSGSLNPVVVRAFIGDTWGVDYTNLSDTYLAFAWNYQCPLQSVDISFYDENGDPLYVADSSNFEWQISLIAEM